MYTNYPLSEAEVFKNDDLEFRTITTILHALDLHDKITLENFQANPDQRRRLKVVTALSSLLVRDCEVLAVLPKRSVAGTTLYLISDGEPDIWHYSPYSLSSPLPNAIRTVQLSNTPRVEVGNDLGSFILRNWDQSFESHVQAFANLLNKCLVSPGNKIARLALDMYSLFQSVSKVRRRVQRSPLLHTLPRVDSVILKRPCGLTVPSPMDKTKIELVLLANEHGTILHPTLDSYLHPANCSPAGSPLPLPLFHQFFLWFLKIVFKEIEFLFKLRKDRLAPQSFPQAMLVRAYENLATMQYFAWESQYFTSYIRTAFPRGVRTIGTQSHTMSLPLGTLSHGGEASGGSPRWTDMAELEQLDNDDALDIATEYETGVDRGIFTHLTVHPCILELRLITSNIQQLETLLHRSPNAAFNIQIIQYARSDSRAMPWRDLINELFPQDEMRNRVLDALIGEPNPKFDMFRSNNPAPPFHGQAHCEAVMSCLYSVANRNMDISWTGIPAALLEAIRTSYTVLAPSTRCCQVCAMINSLLTTEGVEAGARRLHTLSNHSVISPCAMPFGMPRAIREKLLSVYRRRLQDRLIAFLVLKPHKEGDSGQSWTFSQGSHQTEENQEEMGESSVSEEMDID